MPLRGHAGRERAIRRPGYLARVTRPWLPAAPALAAVLLASACGASKPITNAQLAKDLGSDVGLKSPLVCATRKGRLGKLTLMTYTRVCGINPSEPSIYVRTGVSGKPGWCVVTPLYAKAPKCPLQ